MLKCSFIFRIQSASFIVVLVCATVLLVSCKKAEEKATLQDDDKIMAKVNGKPITRYDVDRAMKTSLRTLRIDKAGDQGRKKVLKSLVANRAIAELAEAELTDEEKLTLEKDVQAYREKVLVKKYLDDHAPLNEITEAAIRKYYRDHKKSFSKGSTRVFEMMTSKSSLSIGERRKWAEAVKGLENVGDWRTKTASLQKSGVVVDYRKGYLSESMLHAKLREVLKRMKVGQTSSVFYVDGVAYVLRVVEDKLTDGQDFEEVRKNIKALLEQQALKDAVATVKEKALGRAEVEYLD